MAVISSEALVHEELDHELIELFHDPVTGLKGVIAIHSTALGPAMGGLRVAAYEDVENMVADAMRLSRAMTMKNAAAGLPLGGGKAVLFDDGRWDLLRRERLVAFAGILDRLGGSYITAEDSGSTAEDMEVIATVSDWVAGRPAEAGGRGDPAPYTARTALKLRLEQPDELIAAANLRTVELLASAAKRNVPPLVVARELAQMRISTSPDLHTA